MSTVTVLIPVHKTQDLYAAVQSVKAQTVPVDRTVLIFTWGDIIPQWVYQDPELEVFISKERHAAKVNDVQIGTDWVVILCDDDILHPKFIERTYDVSDTYDIVYTDKETFGGDPRIVPCREWDDSYYNGAPAYITSLIRKEAWEFLGGYDKDTAYFDWDFYWRAFECGMIGKPLHEYLFLYRNHPGQWTHALDDAKERAYVRAKHNANP